jgi:chromosome segregation ATPase
MALEAALRAQVEQSSKSLGDVIQSLSEIRRLATTNQMSSDRLAQLAIAMEAVGDQIRMLLDNLAQTGATLLKGANILQTADPTATILELKALSNDTRTLLSGVQLSVAEINHRLDEQTKGLQLVLNALSEEKSELINLSGKIDAVNGLMTTAAKRINSLIVAVWILVFVGCAGVGIVIVSRLGLSWSIGSF